MSEKIDVFNPFAPAFLEAGVMHVLENTTQYKYPFLHILGARWFTAVQSDKTGLTRTVWEPEHCEADTLIVVDHFLPMLRQNFGNVLEDGRKLFISKCLPAPDLRNGTLAMNVFMSSRSGPVDQETGFSYTQFQNDLVTPVPIVPMGCGASWLPIVNHYDKTIFLDEPHESLLSEMQKGSDDVRVRLFLHALETCAELSQQGFRICTFAREGGERTRDVYAKYDFLEILEVGNWIPFSSLVQYYAQAPLFFSFFTETHGYPIYENMQLGNGIVTYAETFDAFRLRPMQRGALLSIYNTPALSAAMVREYFERYVACDLRPKIRQSANKEFSCETYFERLRASAAFCQQQSS